MNGGRVQSLLTGIDQPQIQPMLLPSRLRLPIPLCHTQPDPVRWQFRLHWHTPAQRMAIFRHSKVILLPFSSSLGPERLNVC